ncbi:hypothetical protein MKW92_035795 [Papaver armeniacum]|nr:hypothetical protein MKW92_035795 [Papaver armeniacum]
MNPSTLQIVISYLLLVSTLASSAKPPEIAQAKPGCQSKCGNVTIPYPFGIGSECSLQIHEEDPKQLYDIECNTSYDPPKPFTSIGNHEVLSISGTEVRIKNTDISAECYNEETGEAVISQTSSPLNLNDTLFTISYAKNRFVAVGCDTRTVSYSNMENACSTRCGSREDVVEGSCTGHGCCQGYIQKGKKTFDLTLVANADTAFNHPLYNNGTYLDTCHIAFLVEIEQYTFQASDLFIDGRLVNNKAIIPVVLDWTIADRTCEEAQQESRINTYACQSNTICTNANNSPGYSCTCKNGYEGNPYLTPGCKDVDECDRDQYENPCYGICTNTNGGFDCSACPGGSFGDGRKEGAVALP